MPNTKLGLGVLTAIHNRVNSAVDGFISANSSSSGVLLALLKSDAEFPDFRQDGVPSLFNPSGLADGLDLDGLLDGIKSGVRERLASLVDNDLDLAHLNDLRLGDLQDFVRRLINRDPIGSIRQRIGELAGGGGSRVPDALRAIVGRQLGVGISFITSFRNLADAGLAEQVLNGWRSYFFGDGGFTTVDGIQIVPPGHTNLLKEVADAASAGPGTADLASVAKKVQELQRGWQGMRGLLGERNAEQYVRDLIRILVEVGGDQRYQLRDRRPLLLEKLPEQKQKDKADRWFKGAASMAESLVTSVVEEVALGIAQFQTNPVLAAAAATYAGTAARKASQHAFLAEADVPIQQD